MKNKIENKENIINMLKGAVITLAFFTVVGCMWERSDKEIKVVPKVITTTTTATSKTIDQEMLDIYTYRSDKSKYFITSKNGLFIVNIKRESGYSSEVGYEDHETLDEAKEFLDEYIIRMKEGVVRENGGYTVVWSATDTNNLKQ